jgi:DNA primase
MAKLAPTSTKYAIKAKIKADGVIEKPDVIGAVFGQTEGLLGTDLDLRELQRSGRIGRIEVDIKSKEGKSEGEIIIPSSLDASETAMIAATLETIDRVGPCKAEIELLSVEDMRSEKRKYVVDKAKDILKGLVDSGIPDTEALSEEIKEAVRTQEISSYQGLPCGPALTDADSIIIVEGRADVVNLLKYGIRNTIAIEGTSIPEPIVNLVKEKVVTLFVDGDRGGQLISKELLQKAPDIDFITSAPEGKEVEELTKKELYKALRDRVPVEQFMAKIGKSGSSGTRSSTSTSRSSSHIDRPRRHSREHSGSGRREGSSDRRGRSPVGRDSRGPRRDSRGRGGYSRGPREERAPRATIKQKEVFKKTLDELVGTRAACILDNDNQLLGKVPITELENTINTMDDPYAIIFDGKVDANLNFLAKKKGVKFLVGMEKEELRTSVCVLDKNELGK